MYGTHIGKDANASSAFPTNLTRYPPGKGHSRPWKLTTTLREIGFSGVNATSLIAFCAISSPFSYSTMTRTVGNELRLVIEETKDSKPAPGWCWKIGCDDSVHYVFERHRAAGFTRDFFASERHLHS